jgi:pimeloyl-ACP methyl ester carboxylesterase
VNVQTPGGRALRVWTGGVEGGTPVLVHHGTPGSGILYGPWVLDALERGIWLIGYDRAGYGASTRHEGRAIADVVADVRTIAAALGIDRLLTWGVSGGGPHALACAALAPDLVAAAACLAGPAPFDAEGLDWIEGTGEANVIEDNAAIAGETVLRPLVTQEAAAMVAGGIEGLREALATLLSPVDAAVLDGGLADFLVESTKVGIGRSVDGWVDDDLAFVKSWGFDVAAIDVPVLLVQGEQDRFVPVSHFEWLSASLRDAETWRSADEGHLSLLERPVTEVHDWLLARWEELVRPRRTRG